MPSGCWRTSRSAAGTDPVHPGGPGGSRRPGPRIRTHRLAPGSDRDHDQYGRSDGRTRGSRAPGAHPCRRRPASAIGRGVAARRHTPRRDVPLRLGERRRNPCHRPGGQGHQTGPRAGRRPCAGGRSGTRRQGRRRRRTRPQLHPAPRRRHRRGHHPEAPAHRLGGLRHPGRRHHRRRHARPGPTAAGRGRPPGRRARRRPPLLLHHRAVRGPAGGLRLRGARPRRGHARRMPRHGHRQDRSAARLRLCPGGALRRGGGPGCPRDGRVRAGGGPLVPAHRRPDRHLGRPGTHRQARRGRPVRPQEVPARGRRPHLGHPGRRRARRALPGAHDHLRRGEPGGGRGGPGGGRDWAQVCAADRMARAVHHLSRAVPDPGAAGDLLALAEFVTRRTS